MGKLIDDHIKVLKSYYNGFSGWVSDIQDSIDVAVDIMRKYQKIEQILNDRYTKSVSETLDEIIEVVENGNEN